MKRLFALFLVALMIFALVGCGSKKREIIEVTLSTEDAEAILAAAGIVLPAADEVACANTTFKWFAWYDDFHNYSEDEVVNTGFYTFKEKYGCDLTWVETTWDTRFDDLANQLLGGTPPDAYPGDTETFPTNCIKGMFQPVDDYIDYDDPLWVEMKDFAKTYFTLAEGTYMIITDLTANHVVAYNRRVIDEWGFDDPAELYYNDEWTWNKFFEMCVDFSDPDEDRYALDGWYYDTALMDSAGVNTVSYDPATYTFVSNLDDPRLERAANLVNDLKKNDCIYPVWDKGWETRAGNDVQGAGIKDGLCLFWVVGTWGFTDTVEVMSHQWGDVTAGEIMFAPLPRDDAGDGSYNMQIKTVGYCIVEGAENPEAVALLASCDRFKILDPTVISIDRKQLRETYYWTDEMLEMYDACYDIANSDHAFVDYDVGLGSKLTNSVGEFKKMGRMATAQTWAQMKEKYTEQVEYYLNELNTDVATFLAGGEVD